MNIQAEKDNGKLIIKPKGRLDTKTASVLADKLYEIWGDTKELIFDFSGLEYTSSAGLRVLLAVQQKMDERGGSMKVININESIRQVFDLSGFFSIIDVE